MIKFLFNNILYKIRFKGVRFYNAILTEVQENVKIGQGSRIGSFTLIQHDVQIGKNCTIGSFCNICSGVRIGDNVSIQTGCHITRGVNIGSGSFIAPHVVTMNDKYMSGEIKPPSIGKNSKVGGGSLVLPEIIIGDNVIIGAGSVITSNIKDGEKVFGSPAKPR